MQDVSFNKKLPEIYDNISRGAFLTVKDKNDLNTMTIGWTSIGIIWGLEIMQVLVRESRHTYQLLESTDEFSVSFVFDDRRDEDLEFCGTKSGRNFDKFAERNLDAISGRKISTPVIGDCDLHYECQIKYKTTLNKRNLAVDVIDSCYQEDDLHTIYFGEILSCYQEESIQ